MGADPTAVCAVALSFALFFALWLRRHTRRPSSPIDTRGDDCARLCEEYVEQVLRYGQHWDVALRAISCDPQCVLAAVFACDYELSIEEDVEKAKRRLQEAQRLISSSTPTRERHYVRAYAALFEGDLRAATAWMRCALLERPTDLFALKRAQLFSFLMGDCSAMLQDAKDVYERNKGRPYFHGMIAFSYEECGQLEEAEREGRKGVQICPHDAWSHHAVVHTLYWEGRIDEALLWMHQLAYHWDACMPFLYAHNWWHVCVLLLDRGADGDVDEMFRLLRRHVWGEQVPRDNLQLQQGAMNLALRCQLRLTEDQHDALHTLWADISAHVLSSKSSMAQLQAGNSPRLDRLWDVLCVYALRKGGHLDSSSALLAAVRAAAGCSCDDEAGVCACPTTNAAYVHVALGLANLSDGSYAQAVQCLRGAHTHEQTRALGGSAEQRDMLEEVYVQALLHFAGKGAEGAQREALVREAVELLERRNTAQGGAVRYTVQMLRQLKETLDMLSRRTDGDQDAIWRTFAVKNTNQEYCEYTMVDR